ncbi:MULTISPECIES: serine--tRNA ligase [Dehalococcoides]|jgi:seryl-tRNA synthetase|uniref:Serine--tRNA ligase n=2 Tax=Dehalococcoides mccartyi TaxID=61435 RepID=SYS_DEHMC|nr:MULTISPECIES: serine--tRNA ligase [Dehalococcoides]A5FRN4.1 RecName: Full=Serine--tRNA ligase; AltName: Full=Seryl-tRNA synthetase; Short=SerRS; AltName: Full=Seryl-tRNA(Ser/Sec) synthetase [Dehalococcoides mccartyi BAV1]Q3ZWY0.1 RecName: Full=Serine--tRNA ligase; AltName: Full=Seryl-tRNA synthetase; Short=SerRS; AltName: Full=Seryl-tRNA(Ser/Sec) synthetase [Dehalococcoides mccartyi CBDB1]AGG06211.1 serine--tRNA ligase [Dehalococcoides mccartyi DCMB5]AGG07643.1 serine--tRNA ligase [Dehalococ
MLDLKFIRENPELVRKAVADRNTDAPIDEILELDNSRRNLTQELDNLRAKRKIMAKQRDETAIEEGRVLRGQISTLESELSQVDEKLTDRLLRVPNIPDPSVPVGKDESENVVLYYRGEKRNFSFTPKPHWELGEALDIIDFDRGIKLSGSRFYILKGAGARLQRALIAFMLDLHTRKHDYTEIYPPYMIKRECLVASGNLPKFADNLYHDAEEDYWWVPTAEAPLTNLHRDEILSAEQLPIHYVAYTACFRREKMSAGKDVRGIKRLHQFDKVELYKYCKPEDSFAELEKMVADAEEIADALKIPYRLKQLVTADISFGSAKSYDIEMYSPGVDEWLEVSSCSNCTDFQGRRANVRFRRTSEAKPEFVHTLNGSGLALPRVMISVIENYQQPDGSIVIPEVLRPFMGVDVIR